MTKTVSHSASGKHWIKVALHHTFRATAAVEAVGTFCHIEGKSPDKLSIFNGWETLPKQPVSPIPTKRSGR
ncbi:MAG: hypothetical protein C9356_02055 [Oleiphilus sp.]|nr:MAG: hypothetical protein C9356_02055 [Oleiphilus sp.]